MSGSEIREELVQTHAEADRLNAELARLDV